MRTTRSPVRLLASAMLAGALLAGGALADPLRSSGASSGPQIPPGISQLRVTTLAELRSRLDDSDLLVALQALHFALSQVGDGGTYVWRKRSRQLMGVIKPTMAFRDEDGRVCRHVVYVLMLGSYSKSIEGIACRGLTGNWTLSS